MNIHELKEMVAKLTAQIAIEEKKQEAEKMQRLIEVKRPAVAEQRARVSQFCAKYKISPTETEREKLFRVVDVLERVLAKEVPDYCYKAKDSCRSGTGDISKPVWKRTSKKSKGGDDPQDLFTSSKK